MLRVLCRRTCELHPVSMDVVVLTKGMDIPLVLAFYLGYKFWKKTETVSSYEMPLEQALLECRNDPDNVPIQRSKWARWNILWG